MTVAARWLVGELVAQFEVWALTAGASVAHLV